jgi:proton glutamate symport protein
MLAGVAIGWAFPDGSAHRFHASDLQPLSNIFLRIIKVLIAPLLFATLVVGIAGHGDDMKRVGRLALRSFIYFEVVTTLALVVGLIAVNLVEPGRGVQLSSATTEIGVNLARAQPSLAGVFEHVAPQSIVDAAARNDVLQIVCFTILFAIALMQVPAEPRRLVLSCCEALGQVMFKFVGLVMKIAPVGIGAAIAVTVGQSGFAVLRNLGLLVLTLYGALLAFGLLVLLPVALACRIPLKAFWRACREPWLIAFTTASSEAALPLAMQNMERFGVPRRIVSFVLPAGYSFNMDGSTIHLALASIFVAQAASIRLPLSQQLLIMATLMLTSKGMAAVPRTSLVILSGTLVSFGLPLEGVAVILGVDALLDMGRTSMNLLGNCLATVVMARWEGESHDYERMASCSLEP